MFDERGYINAKTCAGIAKHIKMITGIKPEIHKTDSYLVIIYMKNGQMFSHKIRHCNSLYVLRQEQFTELFEEMK